MVNATRKVNTTGKPAVTEYRVLEEYKIASLLEINLRTGRTHQIRIHLSAIGHPVLGDPQYGVKTPLLKDRLFMPENYFLKIPIQNPRLDDNLAGRLSKPAYVIN